MYSGANSGSSNNSMLYGGPLGTYLSGIYQPINSRNKATSSTAAPKVGRRSSLRTGINNLSTPSTSSLYYTPQPRRRTDVSEPSKYTNPSYTTTTPTTTTSSRPRSYYTPSTNSSVSPSRQTQSSAPTSSYSRPSSMLLRPHHTERSSNDQASSPTSYNRSSYRNSYGNTDTNDENKEPIDYKKLYEQELTETSQLRKEIEATEQELEKVRGVIDKKRKHTLEENNELEQLKNEGDTLKAENRALSRVVTRLSREK